ncbi:MAG: serine hydrolase domain-containing protein [Pseudomonadota bacterium]
MDAAKYGDHAGLDPAGLARIDAWMDRYVDTGRFPGASILILQDGQPVHAAATGRRSIERDLPFEHDTLVRIYSMTKPITSVALMMLVADGRVTLDAPIDRYLPEFSDCRALIAGATSPDQTERCPVPSVHQLLTHTAGMTYAFNPGLLSRHYTEKGIGFDPGVGGLAPMVRRVAEMPLAFVPGTRWEYSIAIDVLGRLIEAVTGETLDEVFRKRIFEPLGMNNTGFQVLPDAVGRFADCYTYRPEAPLTLFETAETSAFLAPKVDTYSGGGGLVSTLDDMARFAEMMRLGGSLGAARLLSPSLIRFMMRNHLEGEIAAMGPDSFAEMPMHGMGFGLGGSVVLDPARARVPGSVGDFGWGGVASTFFWIDPVHRLSVVFFTQLIPSSTYANRAELKALVHNALTV